MELEPTKPKSVLLFGPKGSGKSSIVNMLAEKDLAPASNSLGVSGSGIAEYKIAIGDDHLNLIDTPGLGDPSSMETLVNFLKNEPVDLFVFCIRTKVEGTTQQHLTKPYTAYSSSHSGPRAPVILVVTGLEDEENVTNWWEENKGAFSMKGVVFRGHVCGTAAKGKRDRYQKEFFNTKNELTKVIVEQVSNRPAPTHSRAATNIIIFGEVGVGKSSIVNMLAEKDVANASSGALGVTSHGDNYPVQIENSSFNVVDTIGLGEGPHGNMDGRLALASLLDLTIKVKGGVHLLVFAVRGRIKKATQENYRLYYDGFCQGKVPIVLVVLGMEDEEDPDGWLEKECKPGFDAYGMHFDDYVIGTATKGRKDRYQEEYERTKKILQGAIVKNANDSPWRPPTVNRLMAILAKLFPGIFGGLVWTWDTLQTALEEVGYSKEDAMRHVEDLTHGS